MDALAVERAILLGSSYGGFTALAFAVQSPDRVLVVSVEAPMMRLMSPTPTVWLCSGPSNRYPRPGPRAV